MNRPRRTYPIWTAKIVVLMAAAGAGILIGLWLRQQGRPAAHPDSQQEARPTTTPKPSATPAPQPLSDQANSLTIVAQRARDYPGGHMVTEQAPLDHEGYREGQISYESDGLKIFAQVTIPRSDRPAGGYPVIVLVHGFVPPQDYVSAEPFYSRWAAEFARQGYLVVKPDLRGHGNSWGVAEGAYYSSGYVADVLNLTSSLADYPEANAHEVSVVGHSMGGHIALEAAVVRPDWFRTVVLAASATGPQAEMYQQWRANSDFATPVTFAYRQRMIRIFGEPSNESAFWQAADPYRFLGDLRSPVGIFQATDDDTVPYRFAPELEAALKSAGRTAALTSYDSGGHSFAAPVFGRAVNDIMTFIGKAR